jgi:acetyl esterase/lipase
MTDVETEPLRYREPEPPVADADGGRTWTGLTYATRDGYRPMVLDVRMPPAAADAPVPAVLWVHGGGWLNGDRRYLPPTLEVDVLARSLLARGIGYVAVDYRHSLEAPFPACLHDVKAAVRYVRRFADVFGIDADRLGALGESAGGHLVALLATTAGHPDLDGDEGLGRGDTGLAAVVDWYGVHDFTTLTEPTTGEPDVVIESLFGGPLTERAELARLAGAVSHVHAGAAPMLLVHGTADATVPFEQSERLLRAGQDAGMDIELRPVPGADHCFERYDDIPGAVAGSIDWLVDRLSATRTEPGRRGN